MLALDTNTVSYYFRGDRHVVPRLQAMAPAELAVPAIVEYELHYGLARQPHKAATAREAALTRLLRPMNQLPFVDSGARCA